MNDFHFDVPEDQRTYSRPHSDWLEWTLVLVLAVAIVTGVGTFIAIWKGWI